MAKVSKLGAGEKVVAEAKVGRDSFLITDKPTWKQMKVRILDPKVRML